MKVCLIRCPSPFLIDERVFPPLGLMSVGTVLRQAGHEVTVYDGSWDSIPLDFPYYGFGPTIVEYGYAIEAKQRIRRMNPDARIIIGGAHATLNVVECLEDGFDCVVTRDGEYVAEEAFLTDIPWIDGGESPLDTYPMPDRSLIDIRKYRYILDGEPATTILTTRGCPYHCGFCSKPQFSVRFNPIPKVCDEIDDIHFNFGYNALIFIEDTFTLNRERTEHICTYVKSRGMTFRCLARGDLIVSYGPGFLSMMRDSGCREIALGIESGSDKILKTINKGETSGTLREAVKLIKSSGIRVKGFFIVGLPGESEETLSETRRFLDELRLDDVDIKIFQPYPGTPIWDNRVDYDISWDNGTDYSKMFYKGRPEEYYGSIRTSALTTEQIYRAWVEMEKIYKWDSN